MGKKLWNPAHLTRTTSSVDGGKERRAGSDRNHCQLQPNKMRNINLLLKIIVLGRILKDN